MILIHKQYIISNITEPFDINVKVPSCATVIKKEYDKNTDILSITIQYCDKLCIINDNIITITVYNDTTCVYSQDFEVSDNCDTFDFTSDIYIPTGCDNLCGVKFAVDINDSLAELIWEYDTEIFTRTIDAESNNLLLNYTEKGIKLNNFNTTITAKAINSNNCVITKNFEFLICNPILSHNELVLTCNAKIRDYTSFKSGYFIPNIQGCEKTPIVFNKNTVIQTIKNVAGIFCNIKTSELEDKISVSCQGVVNEEVSFDLPYSVKVCDDLYLESFIRITLKPCKSNDGYIASFVHNFDCVNCGGVAKKSLPLLGLKNTGNNNGTCSPPVIDIDKYIHTAYAVLWDTFRFIPTTPPQTLVSSYELTTPFANVYYSESLHTVTYDSTGGLTTTDLIQFEIDLDNGSTLSGELRFNGPKCKGDLDIIAKDYTVCLNPNNNVQSINVGVSGTIINITQFPSFVTIGQDGNNLLFSSNGYIGQDIVKYVLTNPSGLSSNEGTITIYSKSIDLHEQSVCLNELGKVIVDLSIYNTNESTQSLAWLFNGYTTDLTLNNLGSGTFIVNNGFIQNYTIGDQISVNNLVNVELSIAGIYIFKTYNVNCGSDIEVYIEVVDGEKTPLNTYKYLCKTTGLVDLFTLVPELNINGSFESIGNSQLTLIDGTKIDTTVEIVGEYMIRYTLPNTGIFNDIACMSQTIIHIIIQAEPTEILPRCIKLCSVGPDPIIQPNCQNIEVDVDIDVNNCSIDLISFLNIPSNSIIKLIDAPLNPILLDINGIISSYRINDLLPNNILNWKYYKAPLGHYAIEVLYGGACQNKVIFNITLVGAGCNTDDSNFELCNTNETINLYDSVPQTNCPVKSIVQVSGTDTTSFDSTTGIFDPSQPGLWIFNYINSAESDLDECEVCSSISMITVLVHPLPGPGVAMPGSVCKAGCSVSVYPDLFSPNQTILGTFKYNGYRDTYLALPDICTPILSTSNGPLTNQPLLLTGNVSISVDTIIANGNISLSNDAPTGFYYFSNTVIDANGCECTSQTVLQVVTPLNAGIGPATSYICDVNNQIINLRDLIDGEDYGGMWIVQEFLPITTGDQYDIALNSGDPGFWQNSDEATFNTLNQPIGTYIFRYIHTTPPSIFPYYTQCIGCGGSYADVTIIINNTLSSGSGSSSSTC